MKGDREPCCTECQNTSDTELFRRLEEVLADYADAPGALIPILQMAQGIFGYLPENVLKHIAEKLGKSYSEVAGVVSFYSFFTTMPRGRHLIRVCMGTACYVRGAKQVLEALKTKLGIDVGQTTPDHIFSMEVTRCFGACGLAPTIAIDDEVFKRVRPMKVGEIIDRYYQKGKPTGKKGVPRETTL